MSEFWNGAAAGSLLTLAIGAFVLHLLVSRAYHFGKLDGYRQVAESFNPKEIDEYRQAVAEEVAKKPSRNTRTMFGDCDEQGRYPGP